MAVGAWNGVACTLRQLDQIGCPSLALGWSFELEVIRSVFALDEQLRKRKRSVEGNHRRSSRKPGRARAGELRARPLELHAGLAAGCVLLARMPRGGLGHEHGTWHPSTPAVGETISKWCVEQ